MDSVVAVAEALAEMYRLPNPTYPSGPVPLRDTRTIDRLNRKLQILRVPLVVTPTDVKRTSVA